LIDSASSSFVVVAAEVVDATGQGYFTWELGVLSSTAFMACKAKAKTESVKSC